MTDTGTLEPPHSYRTYVIVGVVAAAVSAATAAYIFWARSRHLVPHVESVQDLLERCHEQVQTIEQRLNEIRHPRTPSSPS